MSNAELRSGDTEHDQESTETGRLNTGTKFRDRILFAIAGSDISRPNGLQIKEELDAYYGESINHGRLYPNLNDLAEDGFLTKGRLDERTNCYELTPRGRQYLLEEVAWGVEQLGLAVMESDPAGDAVSEGDPDE